MSGGSGDNIFRVKTKKQDSGAGGALILFTQAQNPLTNGNGRPKLEATKPGDPAGDPRGNKIQLARWWTWAGGHQGRNRSDRDGGGLRALTESGPSPEQRGFGNHHYAYGPEGPWRS